MTDHVITCLMSRPGNVCRRKLALGGSNPWATPLWRRTVDDLRRRGRHTRDHCGQPRSRASERRL